MQRAFYFGDIDPSGLRIPARAAQLVAPLPLLPAHLAWRDEPLADRARAVMEAGARLAQEALTADVLRSTDGQLL